MSDAALRICSATDRILSAGFSQPDSLSQILSGGKRYARVMTTQVKEVIVSAIGEHGPISFAGFMDLALYGPGGFYESPRSAPQAIS